MLVRAAPLQGISHGGLVVALIIAVPSWMGEAARSITQILDMTVRFFIPVAMEPGSQGVPLALQLQLVFSTDMSRGALAAFGRTERLRTVNQPH